MKTAYTFIFILILMMTATAAAPTPQIEASDELTALLAGTETYCRRLIGAAFHFMCEERVTEAKETRTFFKKHLAPGHTLQRRETRTRYVNEYQLLKQEDKISERRKPVSHNGVRIIKENVEMKTAILSFKSTLSPYYLFAEKNRARYRYRILGRETVMKEEAHVVRVDLKTGDDEPALFAVVWIDSSDFSILKFRAFPRSIAGYGELENPGALDVRDLRIEDTHYYGFERDGLRFPSKTEIALLYTHDAPGGNANELKLSAGARMLKKIRTVFEYKKYQFFNVTVSTTLMEDEG